MRFSLLLSTVFTFAASIYAQTNGQNSIIYPLGGTLDSSIPVTIKWTPTTAGTITIKLLKGPPANIIDTDIIAQSIENTGSFTWNIPNSLQDSSSMSTSDRYGFKIIDDLTNTFEYSPPFDLSIPDSTFAVAGSTSAGSTTPASLATSTTVSITSTTFAISTTSATSTTFVTSTISTTSSTSITSVASTTITPSTTSNQLQTSQPTTSATATASAAHSSTSDKETGGKPGLNTGIIAAIIIGSFLLAVVSIVMICRFRNRRNRQHDSFIHSGTRERPESLLYGDGMYSKVY